MPLTGTMAYAWRVALVLLTCPLGCALLCAAGCAPDADIRVAGLTLRLPNASDCRPTRTVTEIVVEAFGDFPPSDENTIDVLRPNAEPATIDRFPSDTQLVTVRARAGDWEGRAARFLSDLDEVGDMVLLPENRSCPLPDPALGQPGGVAAALPLGGLILAGGAREGVGSRRLAVLQPGNQLAVPSELELPRVGHGVAVVDDRVLVIGGALGVSGPAHDTFERYEVAGLASGDGSVELLRLGEPRRDFGWAVVPATEAVLIVGGRPTAESAPVDTAELVTATGSQSVGTLPTPRLNPRVVALDDGVVVVAAGTGTGGGTLSDVLVYDSEAETFAATPVRIQPRDAWRAVALPGGRALLVSDEQEGAPTRDVVLLRSVGTALRIELVSERFDIEGLGAVVDVQVAALPDGDVLLTGSEAGRPVAYQVDVAARTAVSLDATRVPGQLVAMVDGTFAELDDDGASLRRPPLRTRLHNPPATLLPEDLALDTAEHWQIDGLQLRARVDGARVDLATLEFRDFSMTMAVEDALAGVEILLRPDGLPPITVTVFPTEVGPRLCTVRRSAGTEIALVRRGPRVTITTDLDERTCTLEGLGNQVGLGVRAPAGAAIRTLRVARD